MGLKIRQVFESLATYGIMSTSDVAPLREQFAAALEDDAEPLMREFVKQGKLTRFQAANLYSGRAKGLVFGEYLISDKIGAGGMGQVYKAQHRKMKRVVALKVLPPQSVGSAKAVQRFYQEVEVAAKLTHPNIVTAYDAGEANGMLFLVMEFVDGRDLSSHIVKHGPLALEQTLNVVLQTARGLAYAHGLGIVHRDIKPSNLLVNRDKVVKILDMGLARVHSPLGDTGPVADELTANGEVMGTVDYMAPEQAIDTRTADHRADIYALGCTMYRLYVGRPPYAGETAVQKILAHRDKPIPSLREARPETPDMVERIYQKMMAKNRDERTQTMAQLVSSLERLLSGVDEERSSVMLGAEPVEEDGSFLPSGVLLGGSSLGGSSLGGMTAPGQSRIGSSGSAGQSGIQRNKPAGSSIGSGPLAPQEPQGPVVVTAAKRTTAKRADVSDTHTPEQTQPLSAAAQRTAAKSATPAKPDKKKLYLAGGAAAAAVVAIAAFFALRGGEETPAVNAASLAQAQPTATAARPTATAKPASTIATTPIPSATQPIPTPTKAITFDLPVSTPPAATASATSSNPTSFLTNTPPAPTPNATATTPAPAAPQPPTNLTGEVDLLALVDLTKNIRRGRWSRDGTGIFCDENGGGVPYLEVPFSPPAEYDLTLTSVPTLANIRFGPGLVYGGKSCGLLANDDAFGVGNIDGRHAFEGLNPTLRMRRFFVENESVTVTCAVRRGRIVASLNGQLLIDQAIDPQRISLEAQVTPAPGLLFLRGDRGVRFTSFKIGPPQISLPPPISPVNLAAAFQPANAVEGTGVPRRAELLLNSLPRSLAKLQFTQSRSEAYQLRAVVERISGSGTMLGLAFPLGTRRLCAVVDHRDDKIIGLQSVGPGGADINPTGRRPGLLLTPGEMHIIELRVTPDRAGYRVELAVDGRSWVDWTGNQFNNDPGFDGTDPQAVVLSVWDSSYRILRFDQTSLDGVRLPVPPTSERTAAIETVRGLTAHAAAKNAAPDVKMPAVDLLRRRAATELGDPALRYEALQAALRLAAEAGDLAGAYEAAEDLATTFDVEPRELHPQILETFRLPRTQTAAKQQFAEDALKLMTRAARSEQFALALDLNAALDKFIGTTNAEMKRELKARDAEYELGQTLQGPAVAARTKLAEGADDSSARTALGKYLACGLGNWPGGLKELAQGDDPGLQAAASLELIPAIGGDAKLAIADKWLELSEKEKLLSLKWTYAEHAALWYRRAAANVSDKQRPALSRQMGKIAQVRKTSNGAGGPRRPLDAVKIGEHWYQLYPNPMHWETAVASCENLGGNLLILDNGAESQAVAQMALQRLSPLGMERGNVWLGANDVEQEGIFRRIDGVTVLPPAYVNWYGGEPNNANGDEDHLTMEVSLAGGQINSGWRDVHRFSQNYLICEWDH